MSTTLFLLDGAADTHLATDNVTLVAANVGWFSRPLGTARGSGATTTSATATVAGPTAGIETTGPGLTKTQWISKPVSADVTISGTITANIWAAEDNMSANVAINVVIDILRAATTTTRNSNTIQNIVQSTRVTEVAVTTRAVNNFTTGMTSGAYTAQTLNRGDRLRIRLVGDDAGTMASGFTFNASYGGATGGADGDTFVTFTEDFSFESAPAGTQLFLTDVQSGLTPAPALISDFTGADENPLSEGGNWANLNTSSDPLQRLSNAASASVNTDSASYWTPANFGADLEAYVTITNPATSPAGLIGRIQGEGGAATWDGYVVRASTLSLQIGRVDNGVITLLVNTGSVTVASGDKLGMRISGSAIEAWKQLSGSGVWNLVATTTDTTYASAGKIGLFCTSTSIGMDDFYAATNSNLFTPLAWTARGGGVTNYQWPTQAGWVAPIATLDWYTKQLTAFTLTGMAQANLRAKESAASSKTTLRCQIARVDVDGTNPTVWADWCISPAATTNLDGELDTTETAYTAWASGDDLSISDGQRLRFRVYTDDTTDTAMVTARTVTFYYAGTSGGASGDSYVTLAQSVTEYVASGPSLVLEQGFVNFNDPGVL